MSQILRLALGIALGLTLFVGICVGALVLADRERPGAQPEQIEQIEGGGGERLFEIQRERAAAEEEAARVEQAKSDRVEGARYERRLLEMDKETAADQRRQEAELDAECRQSGATDC